MSERGSRKELTGVVTSDKMANTIVVKVESFAKNSDYKKIICRAKKFKVHDDQKKAKTGDRVKIIETRPISKDKKWRLVEVLK